MCHLKNAELEPKLQEFSGKVVLWEDIVEDDSGACAVITEQGSSASQMTAAQINGCSCKITRVWRTSSWCSICLSSGKIGGCSQIAQNSQIGVQMFWTRLTLKIPWYLLNDICMVIHKLERQFEEALLELGLEKVPNWECLFGHRKRVILVSIYAWQQNGWKESELAPMWRNWWNMWILTNPHHFLTMFSWDTFSLNANRMKQKWNSIRRCLNHVFIAGATETLPGKNLTHKP